MILSGRTWTHIPRPEKFVERQKEYKTPFTKITEDDVREIRRLWKMGWIQPDLAEKFKISQAMTSRIVNNKAWVHVV